MPRTNTKAVQEVLGADYDPDSCGKLDRQIRSAGLIVDRVVICAAAKGFTLTTAEKADMEMWVAAWLYHGGWGSKTSESVGRASVSYQRGGADAMKAAALALDPSNCLAAALNGNRVATADWLGKTLSEQTDYDDRN